MKARLSVSEGSLALFGYRRVITILFNYLICYALPVVFCYAKKVLPLPQNNNETIMTLLVYPQDRKQAEILTELFREMKVRFEYDDISYEEIDRVFEKEMRDIAEGNFFTHEEVMAEAEAILSGKVTTD